MKKLIDKVNTTDSFMATVRKYTRAKKLTPRMLRELLDHMEVYQAEKVNGAKTQKVVIFYNCVGSIEIPKEVMIQEANVTLHTRQGVDVTYFPGISELPLQSELTV